MGLFIIIFFLILVFLGVPIAISLIAPSVIYILIKGVPISVVAQKMTYSLDSFTLLAVPIFIFVGALLNTSGITNRIFRFANTLVGHLPGGLGHVNIVTNLIMAGASGSALADVGGVGKMLIHAMHNHGYKKDFAAGLTCAAATVGPIFPPSIPLIMIGVITQTSAISLLLSGIMPAIMTVIFLMLFTAFLAIRYKLPRSERAPIKEIMLSFLSALPAILTPVVLIAGMLSGLFSPTEAAAFTVVYILLISIICYREFNLRYLLGAAVEAVMTTTVIMFTVAGAALFSYILTIERVTQFITAFLTSISTDPLVLLLIVNIIVLIAGCFLETIAAIFLLSPILFPPLLSVGVDPVHLGLVIVYNLMIGLLTPPVGMSLYIAADIAKVPVHAVVKQILPYYIPLFLTLFLITYFPQISLFIPNLLK